MHAWNQLRTGIIAARDSASVWIESGGGYFGSVYRTSLTDGQWQADGVPISGETGPTHIMRSQNEGKSITYKTNSGLVSNAIALFVPEMLPNLLAVFDASRNDLITDAGAGAISAVLSRNSAWQLQQATAADRPTLNPTGRNNKPAFVGDGVSDFFNVVPSGTTMPTGTATSVIVTQAYFANLATDWKSLVLWGTGGSGLNQNRGLNKNPSGFVASGGATQEDCITAENWVNLDRIVVWNQTSEGKSIVVDGKLPSTFKLFAMNTASPTNFIRVLRGINDYWPGSFQELMIWNRLHTEAERQKLEGYLAAKWGTRASLPVNHPYKTASPVAEPLVISMANGTGYAGTTYTANTSSSGQWYADGVAIPGATSPSYVMTVANEGKEIYWQNGVSGRKSNTVRLFTPATLQDMNLWLDAMDTSTLTLNGGNVAAWANKAPGGLTVAQPTAGAQPAYSATGRNGKPAVLGAAGKTLNISEGLALNSESLSLITQAFGAFAAEHQGLMTWGNNISLVNNNNRNMALWFNGTSDFVGAGWNAVDKIAQWNLLNGSSESMYSDGVLSGTRNVNYSIASGNAFLLRSVVASHPWTGSVQEIVSVKRALSVGERQKLEGYLAHKWGTIALLPSGHPYKTTPPPADPIGVITKNGTGYVGTTFAYTGPESIGQWYADGVAISGATGKEYLMTIANEGKEISFVVNGVTYTMPKLFTPKLIPDVNMWLDAFDTSTITLNAGKVAEWSSKVAGGISASQATPANQPAYSATARNGKPGVIAGSPATLNLSARPSAGAEAVHMMTASYNGASTGQNKMLVAYGTMGVAGAEMVGMTISNNNIIIGSSGTSHDLITTTPWVAQDKIVDWVLTGTGSEVWADGVLAGSKTAAYNIGATYGSILSYGGAQHWNGVAQEILTVKRNITATERQKLEGYLAHRWGLTANLAVAHPYKTAPPLAA